MKIKISEAKKLAIGFVKDLGFSKKEAEVIAANIVEAEISGKKSHGFNNLFWLKRAVKEGLSGAKINLQPREIRVIKETPYSLYIDGRKKTGLYVMSQALGLALKKAKKSPIVLVGLSNTEPATGFVGHYARKATDQDLIFICFNNSGAVVAPHGSAQKLWGSNAIAIGIPTNCLPVILDMATSKITVGQLLKTLGEKKELSVDAAIDGEGELTTDPEIAWFQGALLPIASHKGSGLSFICELLAGALTGSKVGRSVKGGWGTLFFLISPSLFRPIDEFKKDVETAIRELKNAKKRKGVKEIFHPGEQSQKLRLQNLRNGEIEVDDSIISQLKSLMKG